MGNCVTVARQTLTLFVGVRIPIPQPYKNGYLDTMTVLILFYLNAPHFCRGVHFDFVGCIAHDYINLK